jgi:hypothetical protein
MIKKSDNKERSPSTQKIFHSRPGYFLDFEISLIGAEVGQRWIPIHSLDCGIMLKLEPTS